MRRSNEVFIDKNFFYCGVRESRLGRPCGLADGLLSRRRSRQSFLGSSLTASRRVPPSEVLIVMPFVVPLITEVVRPRKRRGY